MAAPNNRAKLVSRIERYQKIFQEALGSYEEEHPYWRSEALITLIRFALCYLKNLLESPRDNEVTWESNLVTVHYPVDYEFHSSRRRKFSLSLNTGVLTEENTVDEATAVKTLSQIMANHVIIVALEDFTNRVGFEKRGDFYTPIFSQEVGELIGSIKSKRSQKQILEELYNPFSMGIACVDIDDRHLKPNVRVPKAVQNEIDKVPERIHLPPLDYNANLDGRALEISIPFQIHPLVLDVDTRSAYFPITVGLAIRPKNEQLADFTAPAHHWANPRNWKPDDVKGLWDGLFRGLQTLSDGFTPEGQPEPQESIISVQAAIKVHGVNAASTKDALEKMINTFRETGEVIELKYSVVDPSRQLPPLNEDSLSTLLQAIDEATTTEDKGRSLEQLIGSLFARTPGFSVHERVRSQTEEIDLIVINNSDEPRLEREAAVILVECKNWSGKCGKNELVVFKEKIRNRRGRCSIGFLISWNGFAETLTKEMLRDSQNDPLVVPIDGHQIRDAVSNGTLLPTLVAAWDRAVTL